MDRIVCPIVRLPDGTRDRARGCDGRWFESAIADPALLPRLAAALGQRDAILTETIFANFKYAEAAPVVALWRALGPYLGAWNAAVGVIADELLSDVRKQKDLEAEAERAWSALPDRRGAALYIIARAESDLDRSYGDPRWATFDRRFGAKITPSELASMLDQSSRALSLAPVVWPALGRGWSRGDVIAPRLERFLDDPATRRGARGEPEKTVRGLLGRMCDDGARGEVAKIHAVLARRAARSAADASELAPLLTDTDGRHCPKVNAGRGTPD
jgi:hypothetical protein